MEDQAVGLAAILGGSALGLLGAFVFRTRFPGAAVMGLLAAAGAAVGVGAMLVQDPAGAANWVITVGGLAAMVPFHVRVALGPLGPGPDGM